jgi:hypothetical protein
VHRLQLALDVVVAAAVDAEPEAGVHLVGHVDAELLQGGQGVVKDREQYTGCQAPKGRHYVIAVAADLGRVTWG